MSVNEYESFDFFLKLELDMDLDQGFELPFDLREIPRVEDIRQNEINFRKKRGGKSFRNGINSSHDRYSEDNIISKIQVNYINFLVDFVNEVLETIGRKDIFFLSLGHNFKKN